MKEHVCIQLKKEGPGAYPPGFILPSPMYIYVFLMALVQSPQFSFMEKQELHYFYIKPATFGLTNVAKNFYLFSYKE